MRVVPYVIQIANKYVHMIKFVYVFLLFTTKFSYTILPASLIPWYALSDFINGHWTCKNDTVKPLRLKDFIGRCNL